MPIANPNYVPGSIGPGNTPTIPAQATPAPTISPTVIPVASSTNPVAPILVPPTPAINTGATTNASVPIPTIASIVNTQTTPTAADNSQSTLLQQIADITKNQTSLATNQINQENSAGVPALASTLTGLNTQLQGLNDQATGLQNEYNYTIPNQGELNATGLRSEQGQAPLTASALRLNQIKQGAIASQALTVKSAVYAAQGQYTLAKDAADKAAQVAFDASEQQIKGLQAQLAVLAPTLDKEKATQAATLQAQLADRAKIIDNQREDFKTGQALANAAIANNPDDQAAQYAAQQALKLDPTDPQYLQKVSALVGQYQNDITKRALDLKLAQANINQSNAATANSLASAAKTQAETEALQSPSSYNGDFAATLQLAANANTSAPAVTKANVLNSLQSFIASGDYKSAYGTIIQQTGAALKGTDASNFQNAVKLDSTLGDLKSALQAYSAAGGSTNVLTGSLDQIQTKLGILKSDPKYAALAVQLDTAYQSYRQALTGANFSAAEAASYASVLPSKSNTLALNLAKIEGAQAAANSAIDGGIKAAGIGQGGIEIKNKAQEAPKTPDTTDPAAAAIGSTVVIGGKKYKKSGLDAYDPI